MKRRRSSSPHAASPSAAAPQPSPLAYTWQWKDTKKGWLDYDDETQEIMEDSFQKGLPVLNLTHGTFGQRGGYSIDFSNMAQKRLTTQFERPIRRIIAGQTPPVAVAPTTIPAQSQSQSPAPAIPAAPPLPVEPIWQWHGDHTWHDYDDQTCLVLEHVYQAALRDKTPLPVITLDHGIFGKQGNYEVDMNTCQQKRLVTGFLRDIRRQPSMVNPSPQSSVQAPPVAAPPGPQQALGTQPALAIAGTLSQAPAAITASPTPISRANSLQAAAPPSLQKSVSSASIAPPQKTAPPSLLRRTSSGLFQAMRSPEKVDPVKQEFLSVTQARTFTDKEGECAICLESFEHTEHQETYTLPCNHSFHYDCVISCFKKGSMNCPSCRQTYGMKLGNQPEGRMDVSFVSKNDYPLEGYDCETIVVDFSLPSGIQGSDHPNPGQEYVGTARRAFLPDNEEGREVLRLLKIAWQRNLIFTIGRSVTTGRDNQVIWNGIHLKTRPDGGETNHGFPDPGYFDRVKEELKAFGVE